MGLPFHCLTGTRVSFPMLRIAHQFCDGRHVGEVLLAGCFLNGGDKRFGPSPPIDVIDEELAIPLGQFAVALTSQSLGATMPS